MPPMVNRLAQETSPYLLQHAHNPVDWYPWGPAALARAREDDRPIFLSIGYAACHWCHVMAHESFEDADTAAFLNERFVAIKVDREERPDLDGIYMEAVQAMTGSGGWPMSVFLTPDGRPFYGGTYFPDTRRHGMPSFRDVLEGVAEAWSARRAEVEAAAGGRRSGLAGPDDRPIGSIVRPAPLSLDPAVLAAAEQALARSFDPANGSWGGPPKFPQPMAIEFLLRRVAGRAGGRVGDPEVLEEADRQALRMVLETLDAMADGGIRDQLGGGFHRYATDAAWLAPHFEKMLYDNAQLARVYVHAFQLTGETRYREVAETTIDYVAREMTLPEGGFAASQDADSEGEEGRYYTWTADEVETLLGADAPLFAAAYDVTAAGNWEGKTILRRVRSDAELGTLHGLSEADVAGRLALARARLLAARERRVRPARDDKALAAWNGLMLAAVAESGRVLGRADHLALAERAGAFALDRLRTPEGRLRRSWKDGRATLNGYLEDHAHLAEGLLALYEATFEPRWFVAARGLMAVVLARFADQAGGFFDTSDDHEALITRPKGLEDSATPSGGAMTATVLLKLAAYTGEGRYRNAAEAALGPVLPHLGRYPTGFGQWLVALDLALAPVREIAVAGDLSDPKTRGLLAVAFDGFRPHQVVAAGVPDLAASADRTVPLLRDRPMLDGRPTAYVCRGFVCELPVADPAALAARLAPRPA